MVHPLLLGLPWRFDALRFHRGLHTGMGRIDVIRLAQTSHGEILCPKSWTCGWKLYSHRGYSYWNTDQEEAIKRVLKERGGTITVRYVDYITLCLAAGPSYVLSFDKTDHVTSWHAENWADGC